MAKEETKDKQMSAEDFMLDVFNKGKEKAPVVEDVVVPPVIEDDSQEEINTDDAVDDDEEEVVVDDSDKEVVDEDEKKTKDSEDEDVVDDKKIIDDDWDTEDTVVIPDEDKSKISIEELTSSLGLSDIKSKEDLIAKLKAPKEEDKTGKEFDSLPEDLAKAIELAKDGGDYMEYLGISEIDYSAIDPKRFFIEAAKEHFIDENGNLDSESLQDFIDTQDSKMIEIQGATIKKQYVENQRLQKQSILENARKKKELTEIKLKEALKSFDTFNEFKVKESHKDQLYRDIVSGKAMKEMFYNKDGEYDMSKVVKAYFYHLKGEQMESFRTQRARNEAKRTLLKDATNADLKTNGKKVTESSKTNRKQDPFDFLAKQVGMKMD